MDIAVVVNLSARKGSHAFAAMAKAKLPTARVIATQSLSDLERFVDETASRQAPPALVLSGGGDGTAIALLDALRARDVAFPPFGLVPLGTGNGWAISTKAPRPRAAIDQVAQMVERGLRAPPTSDYGLVEVEGRLTPFAGAGWDAELLHDYKLQRAAFPKRLSFLAEGFTGYMASIFGRTIPRNLLRRERPRVRLVNLGAPAMMVTAEGALREVPDSGPGAVLYDGVYGVAGAGTTTDLGFGFKGLHLARTLPGRMHVRVYAASAGQATRHLRRLWRGEHPLPDSHDFLLTHCRMEFDREVPVEVGGDVIGLRSAVEYRLHDRPVPVVDWARVS
ncbi:MAG: diacylglycerol kinase family protein [Myxococcota bacterium]|jgi:diacylglycerol kinase family enzyme